MVFSERMARYRELATKARNAAKAAQSIEVQEAYAAIARSWDSLADESQHMLGMMPSIVAVEEATRLPEQD